MEFGHREGFDNHVDAGNYVTESIIKILPMEQSGGEGGGGSGAGGGGGGSAGYSHFRPCYVDKDVRSNCMQKVFVRKPYGELE